MRVRLTKIDSFQLFTCIKHGLWGGKAARFKDWTPGDYLAVIVDKALAALGEVSGPPFYSKQRVWDNGVFPHRIPIRFVHVLLPENRPPVLGDIRDVLTAAWGPTYGWGILNQVLLSGAAAETIVNAIRSRPNNLEQVVANLEQYLAAAETKRQLVQVTKETPRPKRRLEREASLDREETVSPAAESAHTRAQSALIRLGKVAGCSVWVAAADRNRTYRGKQLGEGCLKTLPNMGLSKEAADKISRIDTIWLLQNAPVCAFEVEATTSVYSGLLRMADLLALVPALNVKLFIVAPTHRRNKVLSELARPTFQKIGLSEYCKFIPAEELELLLKRIEGLEGHVQPTIIETVSIAVEDEVESALE